MASSCWLTMQDKMLKVDHAVIIDVDVINTVSIFLPLLAEQEYKVFCRLMCAHCTLNTIPFCFVFVMF